MNAMTECVLEVAAFAIPFKSDMQFDYVLKKFNFDLLTLSPRVVRKVYGQYICYHVTACVIPFNWICNMTIF